jgi:hypothetical protein
MNYAQLQQAILDDSHRDDYVGEPVQRFIDEGENRIFAKLEAYSLKTTITDAQRVGATGEYTIAGKLVAVRHVLPTNGDQPLDRVDETIAAQYRTVGSPLMYVPRPTSILIAGVPGTGVSFDVHYFGLPDKLAVTPTNTLLDDNAQLYKNAALVSLFQRAQNYDAAEVALQDMVGLINELNRKIKKLLGGRRSANPYNVSFRSSY